ncbi:TIGR02186 family protein [Hyphococcus sp.]|uniref:TIGR02186 family protein n=1 Tax=Hyphococcus sp. TaxID=2038636 RepID=UPI003CCB75A9
MMRIFAVISLLILPAAPASAANINIAFTDDSVEVDTGFSGARLTLFGAVTGVENPENEIDIVSVIRGPDTRFELRQMEKSNLIWTPGKARAVDGAPGLYLTYATRNVGDIAPLPTQAAYRLRADFLNLDIGGEAAAGAPPDTRENLLYGKAFLSEAEKLGIYRAHTGGVEFKKGELFTIHVDLPANTPVGAYAVSVFLFRDGEVLDSDVATLTVNKVGAERRIYEFAHNRPVSYGIACVVLSLFAGWIASLAFRK